MAKTTAPLKITPLGGLDGIGKNMTALELGGDMILVDAGLMFPDDAQPGIDLVLPDYTYVLENEEKLRAIVITHGHEDHTGALPYLLMDLGTRVPVYGSRMTLGLVEGKLEEFNLEDAKLCEVASGQRIRAGAFDVEFFSMTHSIPGTLGAFVRTRQGTVLFTGDYKLDQTPVDGVLPSYAALNRFGEEGVDLLLSDSTNATEPGFTPSERSVSPALRHIIKNAEGRVFVACFASHIHRLQQVCDAAVSVGRKVVVTGRSMITNTKIARDLGYLSISQDDIVDAYEAEDIPDDKVVVLCTGSQGEPLSALARMAAGGHKTLTITPKDTVIISATPVPGNEKSVQSIVNSLSKIGCAVYDRSQTLIHVSGHGSQEELKLMIAMCKPRYFCPVHGEAVHLRAHAELAKELGISEERIFVLTNGETLLMRDHVVEVGEPVECGVVYVDGLSVGDADPLVLRDRQKLSHDGIITCVATVASGDHKVREVDITGRGVSFMDDELLLEEANDVVREAINRASNQKGRNADATRNAVRKQLSNFLWSQTRTRPMIIPVVMEV